MVALTLINICKIKLFTGFCSKVFYYFAKKFFMKKTLVLFLCMFLTLALSAQDSVKIEQQEKNPRIKLSGFGGILSETSPLRKGVNESLGAGGALMINYYFYIGGYAMGMASNHYIDDLVMPTYDSLLYHGTNLRVNYSHAGVWLGGVFFHDKTVHFGVSTRLGWGHIYLTEKYNNSYINNENYKLEYTDDKIFVISPQVELEIKIASWLKANIGLGYNFVTGVEFDRYKEYRFSSPQITVGVYFGGFSAKEDEVDDTQDSENQDE